MQIKEETVNTKKFSLTISHKELTQLIVEMDELSTVHNGKVNTVYPTIYALVEGVIKV